MKTFFAHFVVMLLAMLIARAEEFRIWTDAQTGKTIEAKLVEKLDDNSEIQLMLKNLSRSKVKTSRLSDDDQNYVKNWVVTDIKMEGQTVSTSRKDASWSETWGNFSTSEPEVLHVSRSDEIRNRVVRVDLENRGTTGTFILEVFWFGFENANKNKRVICKMAANPITLKANSKWSVGVSAHYDKRDSSLLYLKNNFGGDTWDGLYVRTWSGYSYGGWALRISNGAGMMIAQQGSQPAFLVHIKDVPIPVFNHDNTELEKTMKN